MINVNLIYPIGSIYLSINSTNPSKIFGGTWEQIKGKFLVGVDESDSDFKTSKLTGGEKTHKLTINEMPSHSHSIPNGALDNRTDGSVRASGVGSYVSNVVDKTNSAGASQAHNNLPPFFTCYIWYRTA